MGVNGNGHIDAEQARALGELHEQHASAFRVDAPPLFPGDWSLDLRPGECPDRLPGPGDQIEAHLVFVKAAESGGRMVVRESKRQFFRSREALDRRVARFPKRLRESWGDGFALGYDQLGAYGSNPQWIPLLPGPVTRQLYWQDYFAMSAKAFEAYNHDPLTWRAVQLQQEFVLGKGVVVAWKKTNGQSHVQAQQAWDEFWKRNRMDSRLDEICRDACILGELFLRYFPYQPAKLTVRSLDPASIYDILTDPEDFETVYAYHQQYQTPYQLYAPQGSLPAGMAPSPYGPTKSGQLTKFVIRQILPQSVDHYRLNVSSSERRGRSDLYPSLSWIERLRHYLTSKVTMADMQARVAWDLVVEGNAADVSLVRNLLFPNGQPPRPGTVFAHTGASSLSAVAPERQTSGSNVDPTFIELANMVCAGPGVPVDYVIQIFRGGTAANALVATEPVAKRLQDRQAFIGQVLGDMGDRVMDSASIVDATIDITFPPIATEDATQTLQNLSFAEANQYLSKRTAGSRAAVVMGIANYDFDAEQKLIDGEFEDVEMEDDPDGVSNPVTGEPAQKPKQGTGRRTLIIATNRQAAKLDPSKVPAQEDDPMGVLVGLPGAVPPGGGQPGPGSPLTGQPTQPAVPGRPAPTPAGPPTRGGFPAKANPAGAAGARAIRQSDDMLASVLAELAGEVRRLRETRKRPDDPAFLAAAEEYRRQSARHLQDLVRDNEPGELNGADH